MKKALSLIAIVAISLTVFLFFASDVYANTTQDNEFTYVVTRNNEVQITAYNGSKKDLVIPESIDGYPVTEIASYAFDKCTFLESAVLPDTLTKIDKCGFHQCTNLQAISVPVSVSYFSPNGILSEKLYSFNECNNIQTITLTRGNGVMPDYTNFSLFGGSANTLAATPWKTSEQCREIIVAEGVPQLGGHALSAINTVEKISLPSTLREMGENAIVSGKNLKEIRVAEGNEAYKDIDGVLYTKDGKELMVYPTGKENAQYAVPEGTEKLSSVAFRYSDYLTSLYLPASVKSINETAIFHCLALEEVLVDPENEYYRSEDGVLFGIMDKALIQYPCGKKNTSYTLPEGTEIIGRYGFSYASYLNEIVLPETLLRVEETSFCDVNIKELVFPESVQYIGGGVCAGNKAIEKIVVKSFDTVLGSSVSAPFMSYHQLYACTGSTTEQLANKYSISFHSIGHDYLSSEMINVCTDSGYITKTCKVCGNTVTEWHGAEGHSYVAEIIAPTCTEKGYTKHVCSKCQDTYTDEETEAIGHHPETDPGFSPTCTESGLSDGTHCTVCDTVLEPQKVIPAKGHSFTSAVTQRPDCIHSGEQLFQCTDCEENYTEPIPALGHNYLQRVKKYAAFDTEGMRETVCSVCGDVASTQTIPALAGITAENKSLIYTGMVLAPPAVIAQNIRGEAIPQDEYQLSFYSRADGQAVPSICEIGQYKCIVTYGKDYTGSEEFYFSVKPKTVTIKKPRCRKRTATVKWKADRAVTGYQIVISENKKFTKKVRTITVAKNTKKSRRIKKLKKGKKYYIKIRSYKTVLVDGRYAKMYSDFSRVKKVKCK